VTCEHALVDYEAGLLDDEELRQVLARTGVVVDDGAHWLLDVERGEWLRYAPVAPERLLDAGAVGEWRARLLALLDDLRHGTGAHRTRGEGATNASQH
jgi:hypothetical protein